MKKPLQKLFESRADELINSTISKSGKSETEWTTSDWKEFSRELTVKYLSQEHKLAAIEAVGNHFVEKYRSKKVQDIKRIENRPDQKDKRAFQEAVMTNIESYERKADAIRDLKIKPEFEIYPDATLRRWLKDIWKKPTKPGRPKKAKE